HQEATRCCIPRIEIAFPEPVIPASRDPREVQRGRPEPPNARDLRPNGAENPGPFLEIAMALVGNTGGDQGIRQMAARRDTQTAILEPGSPAFLGPETLVSDGLVHEPRDHIAPAAAIRLRFLRRNRDGEVRNAVKEIAGAI